MSNDAEEMQEFNNLLRDTTGSPSKGSKDDDYGEAPQKAYAKEASQDEAAFTKHVQYTRISNGFVPIGPTKDTLPPGLYKIQGLGPGIIGAVPSTHVTDNLLRLPDSKSDMVISEIEKFWTLKKRFKKLGFTYKRGFLLWGPQGSGKTSTLAIVNDGIIKQDGVVFIPDVSPSGTAHFLKDFREVEPSRPAIVILEDIDAIIRFYGESDVLSLLDGEDSIDNVVYIATTNYPERLEPRVVNRPSRFDRVVKIGMPSPEARRVYLESRKLGFSEQEMALWVNETKDMSIAHIKELIISVKLYDVEFKEAVNRIRSMSRTPKSDDNERPTGFKASYSEEKACAPAGFGVGKG